MLKFMIEFLRRNHIAATRWPDLRNVKPGTVRHRALALKRIFLPTINFYLRIDVATIGKITASMYDPKTCTRVSYPPN